MQETRLLAWFFILWLCGSLVSCSFVDEKGMIVFRDCDSDAGYEGVTGVAYDLDMVIDSLNIHYDLADENSGRCGIMVINGPDTSYFGYPINIDSLRVHLLVHMKLSRIEKISRWIDSLFDDSNKILPFDANVVHCWHHSEYPPIKLAKKAFQGGVLESELGIGKTLEDFEFHLYESDSSEDIFVIVEETANRKNSFIVVIWTDCAQIKRLDYD